MATPPRQWPINALATLRLSLKTCREMDRRLAEAQAQLRDRPELADKIIADCRLDIKTMYYELRLTKPNEEGL